MSHSTNSVALREDIERLQEIREELIELLGEAKRICRRHLRGAEWERAHRGWIAHLEQGLNNETEWLGRPLSNLEETIEVLRGSDTEEGVDDSEGGAD